MFVVVIIVLVVVSLYRIVRSNQEKWSTFKLEMISTNYQHDYHCCCCYCACGLKLLAYANSNCGCHCVSNLCFCIFLSSLILLSQLVFDSHWLRLIVRSRSSSSYCCCFYAMHTPANIIGMFTIKHFMFTCVQTARHVMRFCRHPQLDTPPGI